MRIKIYAISIPRFEQRYLHISSELKRKTRLPWEVVGVDARDLRASGGAWPHNLNLRDTEVGCALSHQLACRRIVSEHVDGGLIIEDDVLLPNNIDVILHSLSRSIDSGDVVSLYNRTILPEKFSSYRALSVLDMKLIYPMETRFMRTAAAYFLGRLTAGRISEFNFPVNVVADDWATYYRVGVLDTIRLLHPIPVSLYPFESTLAEDRESRLRWSLKNWLLKNRAISKIRAYRRRAVERKRERHLAIVDLPADQLRGNS